MRTSSSDALSLGVPQSKEFFAQKDKETEIKGIQFTKVLFAPAAQAPALALRSPPSVLL